MLNPLHPPSAGRLSFFRRCPGSSLCVAGLPDMFTGTISVQYTLGLLSSLVRHCPTISFVNFQSCLSERGNFKTEILVSSAIL